MPGSAHGSDSVDHAHIRFSDKPFMGSVTAPERARDSVEMARIVFGEEFVDQNAVMISLINANSPLVWDSTMVGSLRVYAESNQATLITPFILAGAMAPVTAAAVCGDTIRRCGEDGVGTTRPAEFIVP